MRPVLVSLTQLLAGSRRPGYQQLEGQAPKTVPVALAVTCWRADPCLLPSKDSHWLPACRVRPCTGLDAQTLVSTPGGDDGGTAGGALCLCRSPVASCASPNSSQSSAMGGLSIAGSHRHWRMRVSGVINWRFGKHPANTHTIQQDVCLPGQDRLTPMVVGGGLPGWCVPQIMPGPDKASSPPLVPPWGDGIPQHPARLQDAETEAVLRQIKLVGPTQTAPTRLTRT